VGVTLIGGPFARPGVLFVRFGNVPVKVEEWRGAGEVVVVAPGKEGGMANVSVSVGVDGERFVESDAVVLYQEEEEASASPDGSLLAGHAGGLLAYAVDSVSPIIGGSAGGSVITLVGRGFSGGTSALCRFGEKSVPASVASSSRVLCVSPPLGYGTGRVDAAELSLEFAPGPEERFTANG
jgi:hypothetical protein